MRRFGRARRGAALLSALIVAAAPSLGATVVAADQATFKPDPILTTVAGGQDFTISIVQSAPVATTGAQASVHFDPKVIQLKDFALGTEYTSRSAIFAFGNADRGTAGNKAAAITYANQAGLLENASGFLLPGSGSIAAGDAIFLTLTFTAVPGGGGSSNFSPGDVSMIDEAGAPIVPHVTQGKVEVTPGGAVGSGPPPSATPSQAPTEPPASPVSPTTPVGVSIAPTSLTLTAGNTARIFLIPNADG